MTDTRTDTVLVLGITGAYGRTVAEAFANRGYGIRALVRDRQRAATTLADFPGSVELVSGDAAHAAEVTSAAWGCVAIVHGVNAAYHRWDPAVRDFAGAVADAAAAVGATILFPGNVYAYQPSLNLREDSPVDPPTDKGEIRLHAEAILRESTTRGARLIILRGGDFYGVGSSSSWMTTLLKRVPGGGPLAYPGPLNVPHQWAYLPDFAEAHVALFEHRGSLQPAETFNFGGHVMTGSSLAETIADVVDGRPVRVRRLPWALLAGVGVFVPLVRELRKMRYLWDEPLTLDGARLRRVLGSELPETDVAVAVARTLEEAGWCADGAAAA